MASIIFSIYIFFVFMCLCLQNVFSTYHKIVATTTNPTGLHRGKSNADLMALKSAGRGLQPF